MMGTSFLRIAGDFGYSMGVALYDGNAASPPTIPDLIKTLYPTVNGFVFGLAPVVVVVMFVFAGIKRLMAADNPKAVQESTATMMWTVIGYAAILLSYLLVRLAASVLGYDIAGQSIEF